MPRNDRSNDISAAALGRTLREARELAGMTQQDVALRADMDRAYISEVENGRRSISVDRLLRICESMNIGAAKVIAETERRLRKDRAKS